MISLILPYWERQVAARCALRLIAEVYRDLDLEVVVVDDGSPDAFDPDGLKVKVVRMQSKLHPLNPCSAFNAGVAVASGDLISLSGVEMLHSRGPVLGEMAAELKRRGPLAYVQAACWANDNKCWHSHSSLAGIEVEGRRMPAGACFHFMSMLSRELWDRAGGFDNDYRPGACYDDPDFLLRLERAGATFVMRDDLVVDHPRIGAHSIWGPGMHERNRQLFRRKWC